MLIIENIEINGRMFIRTYSDAGMMVEREGVRYSEAIDPAYSGRVYTETDKLIEEVEADDGIENTE